MSEKQEPKAVREWWIRKKTILGETFEKVFDKPMKDTIHVIEYSAFEDEANERDRLERLIEPMKAELEQCRAELAHSRKNTATFARDQLAWEEDCNTLKQERDALAKENARLEQVACMQITAREFVDKDLARHKRALEYAKQIVMDYSPDFYEIEEIDRILKGEADE